MACTSKDLGQAAAEASDAIARTLAAKKQMAGPELGPIGHPGRDARKSAIGIDVRRPPPVQSMWVLTGVPATQRH